MGGGGWRQLSVTPHLCKEDRVLVRGQTIDDMIDVCVSVNPLVVGDVEEGFDKLDAPLVN